jgi:hypothetical protein
VVRIRPVAAVIAVWATAVVLTGAARAVGTDTVALGKGIDGITLGESYGSVVKALGKPDFPIGQPRYYKYARNFIYYEPGKPHKDSYATTFTFSLEGWCFSSGCVRPSSHD